MIGIGIFGAGRIATLHAKHLAKIKQATLIGVFDPNTEAAQSLADLYHCQTYSSVEELLSDPAIDGVMICSVNHTHPALIQASAQARKAIFCEKPIAMDLDAILACIRVINQSGVPFCLGFNRRFDPSIKQIKNSLLFGEVGSVNHVSLFSRNDLYPYVPQLTTSNGLFLDMTVHDFDMARWLLDDDPVEIYATGSCVVGASEDSHGDIDTAHITIKSQAGKIATIHNSHQYAFEYEQRIEVHGTKGLIVVSNPTQMAHTQFRRDCDTADALYESFPERYRQAYQLELAHFLDVISSDKSPLVGEIDGLWAHLIARAASQSIELNRAVSIVQPSALLSQPQSTATNTLAIDSLY